MQFIPQSYKQMFMKKKIKLIIFHPYSLLGGADNSLLRLISNLNLDEFSVTFISINDSILRKKLSKKISFIKLKSERTLFSIFELRSIIEQNIKVSGFSKIIFISNQNFANVISIFSTIGYNHIKTILIERNHPDELNFYNNFFDLIKKKIIKFLIKRTYCYANEVLGISKKLSNDLSLLCGRKVKTIYSPSYDISIIKKSKKKLSLRNNIRFILNVSRFSKRKDHLTTLKAFKIFSKYNDDIKLILIGYGTEENNIKKRAFELGVHKSIIFKKTENPYPFMRMSKLVILTSVYEGFPNVLVEAITIGTPVIATNSNAGASEILLNGKGGDLINVGDYKSLAKKMIAFFNSPEKLKAKTIIAQKKLYRFDVKTHANIYMKLFRKV